MLHPFEGVGTRKDKTKEIRTLVFQTLLARSKNEKLGKKDTKYAAEQFGISLCSTQKLWLRGKIHLGQGILVNVVSRKRGRVGHKKIPVDLKHLRNIPLKDRMTLEHVNEVIGISMSTLHRYLQQGLLRRHSNSIKPHLTDGNKMSRLCWAVQMVDQGSSSCGDPRFKGLFDHVFIDEKWFFSLRNQRIIICYQMKMNRIAHAKAKITFLESCFCVSPLDQGLEMDNAFFMEKLVVFLL
jgi:hypothetical protein